MERGDYLEFWGMQEWRWHTPVLSLHGSESCGTKYYSGVCEKQDKSTGCNVIVHGSVWDEADKQGEKIER